jgi:HEAT repeat protein
MPARADERHRIRRHIENLDSADEDVSSRAEAYLIRHYGVRALGELLEACRHPNPVVRFRAASALGHTGDPRAYDTLLRLTDDPDESVRYDATVALGVLGDMRALPALVRMCLSNDVTRPAAMALRKLGLEALPAVEEVLRQGDADSRWSAMQVVGGFAEEYRDERCIELLQKCLQDADPSVRSDAAFWLEEIALPDSTPTDV